MTTIHTDDTFPRYEEHSARIQRLLADIDRQRPLGPDGKHGNRHTPPPAAFQKPVDWQAEIRRWQQVIDEMPPRRTEPIKLTPDQWALLPHGDPRIPVDGQIGDLLGVPVVMVEDESEPTPVAEGWVKPKPRRRWPRIWPRGRS